MKETVVLETNVIAVANGKAPQAGLGCVAACIDALDKARREIVVLDAGGRIFDEYFRHARRSGQPGMGDAFAKWLWDRQGYAKHCVKVDITPKDPDAEDFEEFPDDAGLAGFDRSDRKFVAVALGSRRNPAVLNACDSDWWNFREPLERNGVTIKFLCPELFG